eukprot:gene18069-biopygen5235
MSRGGPEEGVFATEIELEAADPALRVRFQLDSAHEHHPRDMSSPETGHCDGGIDMAAPKDKSQDKREAEGSDVVIAGWDLLSPRQIPQLTPNPSASAVSTLT